MSGDEGLAAFARLGPGARVAGYTIVRAGGVGGMAAVWLARDDASGEHVALKTMLPAFSMRPQHEKMFLAEGRIASRIQHANVCRVRDVGEAGGIRYIVMDWIRGGSLAALMNACGGALPYGVAARIVADVARGLEAVHEAKGDDGVALGIVHRDVSPQNVLVSIEGRATIADFGVAKMAGADGAGTASGFVKGKVRYMAPEQAYAESVDARTDVYALGLVLCEATTGRHPFAADTDVATLAKIASGKAVPLPEIDGFPGALRAIVAKAVEQDADARFASMGAFADALDAFDGESDGGPTGAEDVARFVREALGGGDEDEQMSLVPSTSVGVAGKGGRSIWARVGVGVALVGLVGSGVWRGVGHAGGRESGSGSGSGSGSESGRESESESARESGSGSGREGGSGSGKASLDEGVEGGVESRGVAEVAPSLTTTHAPPKVLVAPARLRAAPSAASITPAAAGAGSVGSPPPAASSGPRRDVLRTRE